LANVDTVDQVAQALQHAGIVGAGGDGFLQVGDLVAVDFSQVLAGCGPVSDRLTVSAGRDEYRSSTGPTLKNFMRKAPDCYASQYKLIHFFGSRRE
jgi:hypothetical protein